MHTTHSNTQYKNESKHSEMGPVRQNPMHSLERRRLTADLILIIFGLVDVCMSDYYVLKSVDGDRTVTRGNPFKLSNYCRTNTRKYFF